MHTTHGDASEVSILNRMLRPEAPTFSSERRGTSWASTLTRPTRPGCANCRPRREGTLTAEEDAEAAKYELLGHLLNIMQSKARRSLKDGGRRATRRPRMH